MTDNKQSGASQGQRDDINLKELIVKINGLFSYLIGNWMIILLAGLLCGGVIFVYSLAKKTNYTAKLSFILDEQSGSSSGTLGAAASIAAQFGINLGGLGGSGGFFKGDNIIEFLKSRTMIDKTLLTEVEFDGKTDLLVNRYIACYGLRKKWADNTRLRDIQFKDTVGIYTQDS